MMARTPNAKWINLAVALALAGALMAGCGQTRPAPLPTPLPGTPVVSRLVNDDNAFAFALYQALRSEKGNLFFSPYSISQALAMTYAGARGETEKEMARALRFEMRQADLHTSFKALAWELAQRGQGGEGTDGEGFRLNIVSALWGQEGYDFLPEFLGLLAADYGAGLERVDFGQSEEARATINHWVEEQTESRIKDLIPSGVLDVRTRLILTNAVYFNAAWAAPFEADYTQDGPFTRLDGSRVTVPMMHETEYLGYAKGSAYQVVVLPYTGWELSMAILLPAPGQLDAFEDSLDAAQIEAILDNLPSQRVSLTLPRFEYESSFSLRDALSALGMPLAFTDQADFSGMTGEPELYIAAVLHKAFVSVDEEGTEAAAATAVHMAPLSETPPEPVEVTVDRPFLFLIRDTTGTILFLGRVLDPRA